MVIGLRLDARARWDGLRQAENTSRAARRWRRCVGVLGYCTRSPCDTSQKARSNHRSSGSRVTLVRFAESLPWGKHRSVYGPAVSLRHVAGGFYIDGLMTSSWNRGDPCSIVGPRPALLPCHPQSGSDVSSSSLRRITRQLRLLEDKSNQPRSALMPRLDREGQP